MRARSPLLCGIILFAFCTPVLWSLDVTQGLIKLTLREDIGRFSISYLTDPKANTYKSFLVSNDPTTTETCVSLGNRVYRLGDASEFKQTVERTQNGARFIWAAPFLNVTEEFTFVTSSGATLADGIRIDLVLKNPSEQDISVGVRFIFDTYLGEASYVHFKTDKMPEVNRELTLTKSDKPLYWVSPLVGDPNQFGLMCILTGEGISMPDRIIFANWKRLNDATWDYETSGARSFNLLPYSVNDSAVSHYFDPQAIPRGAEWRIVTVMGKYNPTGFSIAPERTQDVGAALKDVVNASKDIQDITLAATTDLSTVDKLIEAIDRKIASGLPVTEDELAPLAQVIAELQERSTKFEKGSGK
jgi:hypothetical protein